MKKREVFTIVLAVLLALASFVGCNSEVNEGMATPATVSFAPTAKKSLNQSGSQSALSEDVGDYYWKYVALTEISGVTDKTQTISEIDADTIDALAWTDFTFDDGGVGTETGLGKITGLAKGTSYYFGLRAYTTETDAADRKLVWEGFHISGDSKVEKVKLLSKTQLITIDVYTKGQGYLYFDIAAPKEDSGDIYSSGTDTKYPRFCYTYSKLGTDNTTGTDTSMVIESEDSTITDENGIVYWEFKNAAGSPQAQLAAGTYLFTIWEEAYDEDAEEYVEKNDRRQIIIVNIVSGVDTLISGALDSTSVEVFQYWAYDGMNVMFNKATSTVKQYKTSVYDGETTSTDTQLFTAYAGSHSVNVVEDQWITFETASSDIKLYMNGEEVTSASDIVKHDEGSTLVKASGKFGEDYLLTIYYPNEETSATDTAYSVSFSVKVYNKDHYITFKSDSEFSISGSKNWNETGIVEYSTDASTWTSITDATFKVTSKTKNDIHYLYFRGDGNKKITASNDAGSMGSAWTIAHTVTTNTDLVYCYGNIENLLDYNGDVNGTNHNWITDMGAGCFNSMFKGNTLLGSAPYLLTETLSNYCYKGMFSGCTSLKEAPVLPAKTLASTQCYNSMFNGCSSLKYIKVAFTAWSDKNTENWVNGVKSSGKFDCPESLQKTSSLDADSSSIRGVSYIPSGWTVTTNVVVTDDTDPMYKTEYDNL